MSNNNEHIPSYEFKKYFSANTSADEKAKFESSIEEDSFESEAMEGFITLENASSIPSHIKDVENSIAKKAGLSLSKKITFPIWKSMSIAATVLILFGGTYFIATNLPSNNQLADNKVVPPSSPDEIIPSEDEVEMDLEDNEQVRVIQDTLSEENFETVVLDVKKSIPSVEEVIEKGKEDKNRIKKDQEPEMLEEDLMVVADEVLGVDEISQELVRSNVPSALTITGIATKEMASANKEEVQSTSTTSISPLEVELLGDFENGKSNYRNQNYNEAIGYFQKASSQNQKVYESEYYIGLSFYYLGKNTKAIKSFDNVIESNTTYTSNAKWYKSIALLDKGDKEEATKLLKDLANGNSGFKNQALDKLNSLN